MTKFLLPKKLFDTGKLNADAKKLCRKVKLLNGREAGGDTDIAVLRVYAVGIRSADGGKNYARFLAELAYSFGATLHNVKADEIAALWIKPRSNALAGKLMIKMS